jgi:hypothetical protein
MSKDKTQFWLPPMTEKQLRIFNCYKRVMLAAGPKRSGKTLGVCHKVIRHAIDTPNGHIGVFTKTIKVAVDGGCWTDLTKVCLPQWFENTGIRYTTAPKVDGATRQAFFEINNRHGGTSRIVLNSLDYDDDIEAVIRGKRYSLLWFNELDNFRLRKVFDVSYDQLRMVGLPYNSHQWIADTNPSDEGEDSWIYKLFYVDRVAEEIPDSVQKNDIGVKAFRQLQEELDLIEVMIPDNTFLTEQDRLGLYARFQHDPDLFNRYIMGKWTSSSMDSHFQDVFKPDLHIVGNITPPREEDWEVLLPEENCHELVTGWDIGDTNHGVVVLEPAIMNGMVTFKVLDAIQILKEKVGIPDLTEMALEKMEKWEAHIGRPVHWRHWSDKSAFDHYRASSERYDHDIVYTASKGRINLRAAEKGKNSVKHRINLARRLLFYGRLVTSAACPGVTNMFRGLKKGSTLTQVIEKNSRHKHIFDALTYAIASELPLEIEAQMPNYGKNENRVAVLGM